MLEKSCRAQPPITAFQSAILLEILRYTFKPTSLHIPSVIKHCFCVQEWASKNYRVSDVKWALKSFLRVQSGPQKYFLWNLIWLSAPPPGRKYNNDRSPVFSVLIEGMTKCVKMWTVLIRLLQDEDCDVRQTAAATIHKIHQHLPLKYKGRCPGS